MPFWKRSESTPPASQPDSELLKAIDRLNRLNLQWRALGREGDGRWLTSETEDRLHVHLERFNRFLPTEIWGKHAYKDSNRVNHDAAWHQWHSRQVTKYDRWFCSISVVQETDKKHEPIEIFVKGFCESRISSGNRRIECLVGGWNRWIECLPDDTSVGFLSAYIDHVAGPILAEMQRSAHAAEIAHEQNKERDKKMAEDRIQSVKDGFWRS
jgi:hypothetical protein